MDKEFLNVVWVTASVVAVTGTTITLLVLLCKASQRCRARYRHRKKVKQQKQQQQVVPQTEENPPTERLKQQQQKEQQGGTPAQAGQAKRDRYVEVEDEDEEADGRRSVTCCNCFTISTGYVDEPTGGSRTSVYTFDDFVQRSFSHSQQETTQSGSTASAAQAVTSASASATGGRDGENRKSSVKQTQSLGRSSSKGSRKRSGLARRRSLQAQESAAKAAKAAKETASIEAGLSVDKDAATGQQPVAGADPLRSLAIDMSDSDCDDCSRDNDRSAAGHSTITADFFNTVDRRQPSGLLEKYEMEWPPRPSNRPSPRSSQVQLDNLHGVQARAAPGRRGHIIFGRGNSSLYSAGQL